ncbi:MAG: hypothetical protein PF505_11725 [Vallitaleaceae bacterium]|jgi:central glycolytic genes regulator|nr:hypothetical protein [Vallitaleaceae bacterium]
MLEFIQALQRLIPKEMTILERRYQILRGVQLFSPIGRRGLSEKLGISEKIIRNEVAFLTNETLINKSIMGVELTETGHKLIEELKFFMKQIDGLNSMETRIKEILGCPEVIIVSGDLDVNEDTKSKIGKSASEVLLKYMTNNMVVALAGGRTVSYMVNELRDIDLSDKELMIVPARGSLGHEMIHQANSLVARLAGKLKATYTLLNIPDNLSEKALTSVREEPEIHDAIDLLINANILVFGIGTCDTMIERRNLEGNIRMLLEDKKAVAEALGNYFNIEGDIVYTSRSIGISIDEMQHLEHPIAIAGGTSKGEAIYGVRKFLTKASLVIDEGAAKKIMLCHLEQMDREE